MSQQINLFNEQFEHKRQRFTANTMALAAGVLVLGLGTMGVYAKVQVAGLQRDADAGAARLDKARQRLAAVGAEFAPRKQDPALDGALATGGARRAGLQPGRGAPGRAAARVRHHPAR
jgi:hypothetical protein